MIELDRFVRADDVEGLFAEALAGVGRIDYVVDAIDTVSAKLAIAEWAERTATPLIASMGGANKLDPEKLRICDIAQTSHDPLAAHRAQRVSPPRHPTSHGALVL